LTESWMNPMMELWKSTAEVWTASPGFAMGTKWPGSESEASPENPWAPSSKLVQAFFESSSSFWKGTQGGKAGSLPQLTLSFMQAALDGYIDLQNRWMAEIQKSSPSSSAGGIEELTRSPSAWFDAVQQLLHPFLNMPAVGLTRSYQEQTSKVIDKYNVFVATLNELLYQLWVPMEKASTILQEKLAQAPKEAGAPQDDSESYKLWITALEGCYMDLLRSPDYIQQLHKTVDSYNEYCLAQEQAYNQSLRNLPSHKDLDELSKEIYLLKKRLRELIRVVETHG
jgi:polyhydroxyalkanoate synthase subunit PhaE